MQKNEQSQVAEQQDNEVDLFGEEVTPEALENYVQSNYSTSAQASLMTALALAAL
jgi:hypothetical protein